MRDASSPQRSVPMFSLFQQPPEDTPPDSEITEETPRWRAAAERLRTLGGEVAARLRASVPDRGHWNSSTVILTIALVLALVFGFHERSVVAHLQAQPGITAPQASAPEHSG